MTIVPARTKEELLLVTRLFEDYANQLDIDLGYQDFSTELATLPGQYVAPEGEILIARGDNNIVGCVALRPMQEPGWCEMKRLYVLPKARGRGIAKALVEDILKVARKIGYKKMFLDTLSTMTAATALYEKAGFQQIPAYYDTPINDTVFFALDLQEITRQ